MWVTYLTLKDLSRSHLPLWAFDAEVHSGLILIRPCGAVHWLPNGRFTQLSPSTSLGGLDRTYVIHEKSRSVYTLAVVEAAISQWVSEAASFASYPVCLPHMKDVR